MHKNQDYPENYQPNTEKIEVEQYSQPQTTQQIPPTMTETASPHIQTPPTTPVNTTEQFPPVAPVNATEHFPPVAPVNATEQFPPVGPVNSGFPQPTLYPTEIAPSPFPTPTSTLTPSPSIEGKRSTKGVTIAIIALALFASFWIYTGWNFLSLINEFSGSQSQTSSTSAEDNTDENSTDLNNHEETSNSESNQSQNSDESNKSDSTDNQPTYQDTYQPNNYQFQDRFFQIGSRTIGGEEKNGTFGCTMDIRPNEIGCTKTSVTYAFLGNGNTGMDCKTNYLGQKGDVVPFLGVGQYYISDSGKYACYAVTDDRVQCWETRTGQGFEIGSKGDYLIYQR